MRKGKNSMVVHGDIFIITWICVLVIWFDPTVECQVGAFCNRETITITYANIEDPAEMHHNAAFHRNLHCL